MTARLYASRFLSTAVVLLAAMAVPTVKYAHAADELPKEPVLPLSMAGRAVQAAMEAIRQWQYTPTRLNNVPIPVIMTVTVQFSAK